MWVLTALFAAIIGAKVNNVFTWGIKDKVDNLDLMYINILKLINYSSSVCTFKINENAYAVSKEHREYMGELFRSNMLVLDDKYNKIREIDKNFTHHLSTITTGHYSVPSDYVQNLEALLVEIILHRRKVTSFCYAMRQFLWLQDIMILLKKCFWVNKLLIKVKSYDMVRKFLFKFCHG